MNIVKLGAIILRILAYKSTVVSDVFNNENLYENLKNLLDALATKTARFSTEPSSNQNESLNATIVSKAPQCRCQQLMMAFALFVQ